MKSEGPLRARTWGNTSLGLSGRAIEAHLALSILGLGAPDLKKAAKTRQWGLEECSVSCPDFLVTCTLVGSLLCVPWHVLNVSFSWGPQRLCGQFQTYCPVPRRPAPEPLGLSWFAPAMLTDPPSFQCSLTTSLKAGLRLFFLKFFFHFYFMCTGILPAHMSLYHLCAWRS